MPSFWFALQERRDRRHADAVALVNSGVGRVVVSNHVLGETWTCCVDAPAIPPP